MAQKPLYDLVVFGATSFVGSILCEYLVREGATFGAFQWAMAGRSADKLSALQRQLGLSPGQVPIIVADASDDAALQALCAQTRVVLSTVGPYALYGEPLVRACAASGTDYCDLTGEVQWIRRMIERYEAQARTSGARIVHCCGFDSIPSDLGVQFLQEQAVQRLGGLCQRVKMRVRAARGEFSGGTVASILNVVREVTRNPALRKELANPYSLCLGIEPSRARQPDVRSATWDAEFGSWSAPFIMAAINTRIVQRSNALGGQAYGPEFQYDEAMLTGKGAKGWSVAQAITAALAGFMVGAALPPTRWVLERFVVPKPGEGPSPEAQEKGFYDLRFHGRTISGASLSVKVTGDRDPGYGSTAKMLAQAGLCLALDVGSTKPGGFWTPATALGAPLRERLIRFAGLTFDVIA